MKKSQGAKSGEYDGSGMTATFVRQKLLGGDGSVRRGRCDGEAARFVLSKVRGNVFARFHAAKRHS
jgi:hypothetical protein